MWLIVHRDGCKHLLPYGVDSQEGTCCLIWPVSRPFIAEGHGILGMQAVPNAILDSTRWRPTTRCAAWRVGPIFACQDPRQDRLPEVSGPEPGCLWRAADNLRKCQSEADLHLSHHLDQRTLGHCTPARYALQQLQVALMTTKGSKLFTATQQLTSDVHLRSTRTA